MIITAHSSFPATGIRLFALSADTKNLDKLPGAEAFPGLKTAWEQIPKQKYRTLFGPGGAIAYLVKTDQEASIGGIGDIARKLAHRERERLTSELALHWDGGSNDQLDEFLRGLFMGTYVQGQWQEKPPLHPLKEANSTLVLVGKKAKEQIKIAERAHQTSDTQQRCMDLVNAPANKKRPQDLAAWARESGRKFGYDVRVFDKTECERQGFHAFLAVNRGSEDPARFIIQEYKGAESKEGPIVLVGKGVTFDTGGVSIKGSTNLHLMKSDMGGAAAVFGTIELAARLKLPVHVIGLVPATDNSVDALSYKPSDVIRSHSGKSIEIIDTDAEGRLVMCDALSYAVTELNPSTLIDVATLTGSAVRTFGYECAALMSKNEELVTELRQAGNTSGERCWPLPMWDEYKGGLNSDIADIKNYSGRPINGAIDAAKFLEFFTQDHQRFAHLDIAGVALKAGPFSKDRMATGFGVRLLTAWLEK